MRVRQGAGLLTITEPQPGEHIKGHPNHTVWQLAVPRSNHEEGKVLCQPILNQPCPHPDMA